MKKWIVLALVLGSLGVTYAQAPTASAVTLSPEMAKLATPALTDVQKLQIQVPAQRIEIAQLTQSLQIPGWDLDLQQLTYAKKPEVKKEPPKQ